VSPPLHVERTRSRLAEVELLAEAVEPRVARRGQSLFEAHRLVDPRLDVVEDEPPDVERARAWEVRRGRDQPGCERSLGHDRLEGRARRIQALRGTVEQRRRALARPEQPVEIAGIARGAHLAVAGIARERDEAAGLHVEDDGCAGM
jgi:hypothetical protein